MYILSLWNDGLSGTKVLTFWWSTISVYVPSRALKSKFIWKKLHFCCVNENGLYKNILFWFVVIYLHVYVHVYDIKKIYYRILALQISRLDKRIDELEQLANLEEEIGSLREKFKGNTYCSHKKNLLIISLIKIEVFRHEKILKKY